MTFEIIEKHGVDRILHFALGGLICAWFAIVLYIQNGEFTWNNMFSSCAIGTIVTIFCAVAKEGLDGVWDWKDFRFSVYGVIPVWLAFAFGTYIITHPLV